MGRVCRHDSSPALMGTVIPKAAVPTGHAHFRGTYPASIPASMLLPFPLGLQPQTHHHAIIILWPECTNQCLKAYQNLDLIISNLGHSSLLVATRSKSLVEV